LAHTVLNLGEFAKALARLRERPPSRRPRMLAFFLFDERQSHQTVMRFAQREFPWLDSLAASNQMVLFFFLPSDPRLPDGDSTFESPVLITPARGGVKNPSLFVAQQFGLSPSDLPGVVFFTELDVYAAGPHQGVFWPLPIQLFDDDAAEAEDAIAALFELVQSARGAADAALGFPAEPQAILDALRAEVRREQYIDRGRPILAAVREGAFRLVTSPTALIEALKLAFR